MLLVALCLGNWDKLPPDGSNGWYVNVTVLSTYIGATYHGRRVVNIKCTIFLFIFHFHVYTGLVAYRINCLHILKHQVSLVTSLVT